MVKFLLRCYEAIRRKTRRSVLLFANSASAIEWPQFFANEFSVVNEATKLRRVMLAPYGDWPNEKGLQRFKKEDAQNIVNEFENVAKRALTPQSWLGLPWYEGHPDHPSFRGKPGHTRSTAVGRIKGLEAGDDGLYANVKFNDDGESLIRNESYHGHSTNWFLNTGTNGDKGTFRPFRLKSVGFTNEPNIPVPAVTTANAEGDATRRFQTMTVMRGLAANTWSDAARKLALEARKRAMSQSEIAETSGKSSDHDKAASLHMTAAHAFQPSINNEDQAHYSEHLSKSDYHVGKTDSFKPSRHQAMAKMRGK